jgi:hypothetical protein
MKPRYFVLLAGLAGIATGGIGLTAIHAQAPANPTPPAYYIADFELTDPEGIRPYTAGVVASFPSHPTSFCDGAFALHCNADASKGEERS